MIHLKKAFTLPKSQLNSKFRVENNNLDITALIASTGFEVKKIRDIAKAHRIERKRKATAKAVFKYVQISDIDVTLGRIKSYKRCVGADAPNNARRIMHYGDILISTRRPTRGAVVAVPRDFDNDICTVFFTTLTVTDWEIVDPWYLAIFLRTSLGRFQFQSLITETAYPVISDDDVETITVLLPSVEIQREIVANYSGAVTQFFDKLNDAHSLLAQARQEVETLILGNDAEQIEVQRFGLDIEEIADDEDAELGNEESEPMPLLDRK